MFNCVAALITQLESLYENKTVQFSVALSHYPLRLLNFLKFVSSVSVSFVGIYQLIGCETIEKVVEIVEEKDGRTVHTKAGIVLKSDENEKKCCCLFFFQCCWNKGKCHFVSLDLQLVLWALNQWNPDVFRNH